MRKTAALVLLKLFIKAQCVFPCVARAQTKESQLDQFWRGADFGYVVERRAELTTYCKPQAEVS